MIMPLLSYPMIIVIILIPNYILVLWVLVDGFNPPEKIVSWDDDIPNINENMI